MAKADSTQDSGTVVLACLYFDRSGFLCAQTYALIAEAYKCRCWQRVEIFSAMEVLVY